MKNTILDITLQGLPEIESSINLIHRSHKYIYLIIYIPYDVIETLENLCSQSNMFLATFIVVLIYPKHKERNIFTSYTIRITRITYVYLYMIFKN